MGAFSVQLAALNDMLMLPDLASLIV